LHSFDDLDIKEDDEGMWHSHEMGQRGDQRVLMKGEDLG